MPKKQSSKNEDLLRLDTYVELGAYGKMQSRYEGMMTTDEYELIWSFLDIVFMQLKGSKKALNQIKSTIYEFELSQEK
jgi:hypothetical protein